MRTASIVVVPDAATGDATRTAKLALAPAASTVLSAGSNDTANAAALARGRIAVASGPAFVTVSVVVSCVPAAPRSEPLASDAVVRASRAVVVPATGAAEPHTVA